MEMADIPPLEKGCGLRSNSDQSDGPNIRHMRKFVKSLYAKDTEEAKRILEQEGSDAILSYSDDFGSNALANIIESGSKEVLETILKHCKNGKERKEIIRHALLFAIKTDNLDMIKLIMEMGKREQTETGRDDQGSIRKQPETSGLEHEFSKKFENSEFSSQITAIGLAAKLENHRALKLLLQDKALSSELHPVTGSCPAGAGNCILCDTYSIFKGKSTLESTLQALEIYKALSSPAYMLHSGVKDPILEAFKLSANMERMKDEDPALRREYGLISQRCRLFARDLLALCRSTSEVEELLKCQDGASKVDAIGGGKHMMYPRLSLALHYDQKEFVCHPYCQHQLQKIWCEGYPDWVCKRKWFPVLVVLFALMITITLPLWCILYMIRIPFACRLISTPVVKFLTNTISYFFFLILIFIQICMEIQYTADDIQVLHTTAVEWLICLWVVGITCECIRRIHINRKRFMSLREVAETIWRFYDVIMLTFFWIAIIGRIIDGIMGSPTMKENWNDSNPRQISAIAEAVGIVFAVLRLIAIFKQNKHLGPLQLSLKKMVLDICCIIVLFIIVLSAFSFGLTSLYNAYGKRSGQEQVKFTTFVHSYKTLFWAVYGYAEPDDAILAVQMCQNTTNGVDCQPKHMQPVTELTGYVLYGVYHVVVIIVLLNMLIAMMAKSYDAIEANSDNEWKFARTRLRMSYFNEAMTLPPPFNLFPIHILIAFVKCKICSEEDEQNNDEGQKIAYKKLIKSLIQRYWNRRQEYKKEISKLSKTTHQPKEKPTNEWCSRMYTSCVPHEEIDAFM